MHVARQNMGRRLFLATTTLGAAGVVVSGCAPTYQVLARFTVGKMEAGHTLYGVVLKMFGEPALRHESIVDNGSGYLVAGFTEIDSGFDPTKPYGHEILRVEDGEDIWLSTAWHKTHVLRGEEYILVVSDALLTKPRRTGLHSKDRKILATEEAWASKVRRDGTA